MAVGSELRTIAVSSDHIVSARIVRPPTYGPGTWPAIVLAHGAGTDRDHPSLRAWQEVFAQAGYLAVVFNFPYRERGRTLPDPRPVLEQSWRAVIDHVRSSADLAPRWLAIGGRSMGGRMATYVVADGVAVDALALLAYPLHPAGRPDRLRADHLPRVVVPTLFVQGTRDALAERARLATAAAAMPDATIHWIDQGDHGFRVPKRTGRSEADVHAEITGTIVAWLKQRRDNAATR